MDPGTSPNEHPDFGTDPLTQGHIKNPAYIL